MRGLNINNVVLSDTDVALSHTVKDASLGSALVVELPEELAKTGTSVKITISYATSPEASGIQWLAAAQTAGKTHPYLFTQCQAIHARSVLPCQDTPAVKCQYAARITVPSALTALMSAASVSSSEPISAVAAAGEDGGDGPSMRTFSFEQKVPVQSYLIALVVGALESHDLSERCRVWSEPQQIEASAREFGEVEEMLQAAESLLGPYVWGRYDLLVLPPSFPYGGMENPMLTFVTPTLLAGDRSLTSVVIHEITHSWTGNLVTNAGWEHFWLNEGFTVFAERKIYGALKGEAMRQAACIGGLDALRSSIDHFGADHKFTRLCPPMDSATDPDDAFSSVPYEKGSNLLYYPEQLVSHFFFLARKREKKKKNTIGMWGGGGRLE